MITLCGIALSNYYSKVKLVLLEKGLPFTEEPVKTGSGDEAVLAASPLGKIPFIRHVQIFENRGPLMGASNPHPHCQIWANASRRRFAFSFIRYYERRFCRKLDKAHRKRKLAHGFG